MHRWIVNHWIVYCELAQPGRAHCENSYIMYEINITNFFNVGIIFTPIVFILSKKKYEDPGNRWALILIYPKIARIIK